MNNISNLLNTNYRTVYAVSLSFIQNNALDKVDYYVYKHVMTEIKQNKTIQMDEKKIA